MTSDNPEPADVAEVYSRAVRYAERLAGGCGELEEVLIDAATDAVLRARETWRPDGGATFAGFVHLVVERRVRQERVRFLRRRRMIPLSDLDGGEGGEGIEPAAVKPIDGAVPLSPELRDLAPELREAVAMIYVGGFTYAETSKRLDISAPTIRRRLEKAAAELAEDGVVAPPRRPKEKRVRGGKGH